MIENMRLQEQIMTKDKIIKQLNQCSSTAIRQSFVDNNDTYLNLCLNQCQTQQRDQC